MQQALTDPHFSQKNSWKQRGSIYVCYGRGYQISASLAFKINRACLVLRKVNVIEINKDRFRDRFSKKVFQ